MINRKTITIEITKDELEEIIFALGLSAAYSETDKYFSFIKELGALRKNAKAIH